MSAVAAGRRRLGCIEPSIFAFSVTAGIDINAVGAGALQRRRHARRSSAPCRTAWSTRSRTWPSTRRTSRPSGSRIRDVDMAAETVQLTKYQILQQAGTAMLAQANVTPQAVLQLLQGS